MNKIKPLSEQLTNLIAAGEVVERPSGVLKELIENSIDAQATKIEIEIKNGGLDLIQVQDNGSGISKEDLSVAFKRHATSKISSEADLNRLKSLGFRGEALPSIASVSRVEMISKTKEDIGYRYVMAQGKELLFEPTQANNGTTVIVTSLFYKHPARLKYLKHPRSEAAQCLSLVQSFALGNPSIAFLYISDGKEIFSAIGSDQLESLIYQIYGYEISQASVLFEAESFDFKISGSYVLPTIQRASRQYVHLFLNGRLIRYYKITQRIFEIFHKYMPSDRYPFVLLFIETDPQLVDVNVHPSKWEIRLSNELQLLDLVETTLRESLTTHMGAKHILARTVSFPAMEQTLDLSQTAPLPVSTERTEPEAVEIREEPIAEKYTEHELVPKETPSLVIRALAQHHGNYILAEDETQLYLIDQHAAMERIQYEKIMQQFEDKKRVSMPLLFPITLSNQHEIVAKWDKYERILNELGISLDLFGEDRLILREVPDWLVEVDTENFLNSLMDLLREDKDLSISYMLKDKIATMACHRSIRFNDKLDLIQMEQLIKELFECENPYNCPHGRPTFILLNAKSLLKEFGR